MVIEPELAFYKIFDFFAIFRKVITLIGLLAYFVIIYFNMDPTWKHKSAQF